MLIYSYYKFAYKNIAQSLINTLHPYKHCPVWPIHIGFNGEIGIDGCIRINIIIELHSHDAR